jgi:hypothetical protein
MYIKTEDGYRESFNGEIDNQYPELYDKVLTLINRSHDLVNKGYDLPLAFDDKVPEVRQFYEDVRLQIEDVALRCYSDIDFLRTLMDVVDDYGQVISILSFPSASGAEDRLNQIFHKGKYGKVQIMADDVISPDEIDEEITAYRQGTGQ